MSLTQEVNSSARVNSANNPIWMDGLRILLGLFLFFKGIMFLEHTSDVFYIFSQSQDILDIKKASILTSVVHIVGGLMIAFGCLTRLALLCQFPILIGAVLIVNPQRGVQVGNTELWLSILVTCLLLFFMIVGPGRYSVDNKLLRQKYPEPDDAE
ncbi:DoxX family protein [Pontibacter pamirensis]|uniref:DoxX family protein n=1 Tax=Pontibacter pamirensis TaxID=2562824 RepID=UPI00138A38C4|nr:DoxX family protein [Pontibacter pamirensis]